MTHKYLVYDNAKEYLADDPPTEEAMADYGIDYLGVDVDYNDDGTIKIWGRVELYREDESGFLVNA